MPELSIPKREPVAIISAIVAATAAVIGVAVAFGVQLTEQQTNAILVAIGPVSVLVVLIIVRPKVTPTDAVAAQINLQTGAIEAGPAAEQRDGTAVTVESVAIQPPPVSPGQNGVI